MSNSMQLYHELNRVATIHGSRLAIVSPRQSYRDLLHAIDERASALSGVALPGSAVLVSTESPLAFIRDFYALNKLQCVVVPNNPDVPAEVKWAHAHGIMARNGIDYRRRGQVEFEDVAAILFTSGSTALPKAVYLTNQNLISNCHSVGSHCLMVDQDVCGLLSAPLHYVLGLNMQMNLVLLHGGSLCIPQTRERDEMLRSMREGPVNYISGVPMFFRKLMTGCIDQGPVIGGLKYAFIGGAAWDAALVEDMERHLGIVPAATYGLTEASPITTFGPMVPRTEGYGWSVGRAIPGVELALGANGEILIRGKGVAVATGHPHAQRIGEWLSTGDCGRISDQGDLYITGRLKEIINKGGIKISCGLVEQEIRTYAGVIECVVGAIPSHKHSEDIGVAIHGSRAFAVTDFTGMHAHLRPRLVLNLAQLPTLPASGKIDRKAVRDMLMHQMS